MLVSVVDTSASRRVQVHSKLFCCFVEGQSIGVVDDGRIAAWEIRLTSLSQCQHEFRVSIYKLGERVSDRDKAAAAEKTARARLEKAKAVLEEAQSLVTVYVVRKAPFEQSDGQRSTVQPVRMPSPLRTHRVRVFSNLARPPLQNAPGAF